MKKMSRLVIAIVMMFTVVIPVSAAEGNVTYSGNAGDFIFEPGSQYSPTDIFPNFKDVMPGDMLTQNITVRNNATKSVRIYMRALGAHEDSVEFLSQLNLYVEKATDTPLFEAPADQTAQLTEWRELGMLAADGEVDLEVSLDVPVTLDNENKNLIGYLDWEFKVEEVETPKTGDNISYWPWVAVVGCSVALIVIILIIKRRKDNEEETN